MFISFKSLRWKLMTGFVGLVVLIVMSILFVLSALVEQRIRSDIDQNFIEAGRIVESIHDLRFRQLRQTSILLADIPSLKAAITTADTNTVNEKIREELLYLLDFDPLIPDSLVPEAYFTNPDSAGLLMITDNQGRPLGRLSSLPLPQYSIADRPGVTQALQGEMPSQTFIWKEGDRYFNVISIPIWAGFSQLGTLSYGLPIRQIEAEQISKDLGMDILFYVDDQVAANTVKNLNNEDSNLLRMNMHESTFNVLTSRMASTTEIIINDSNYLLFIAPMFEFSDELIGIKGYFGVIKSLDEALLPLQRLQLFIFVIGLISVVASVFISSWLTRLIIKPVNELVEGVKRVEQEDFSMKVPVTTEDELGLLTLSFNSLVESLRERLQMLKFVSTATLDAIKENLSQIKPGGERREVTVFFSDIRGFTAWSEHRAPEQVIDMLNNLLSIQADIVSEMGGDVDKFVGDELVAVFQGADKDQQAVKAATLIQQRLPELLDKQDGDLAVGIGINSGEVVMGAMGSDNRMDYTVLGSTVNLGARLCSAAARHQILISHDVYLHLERMIPVNPLEEIQVKGIERPIRIYEVLWNEKEIELTDLKG